MSDAKDLATCIAALESIAAWDDGDITQDPLLLDTELGEPLSALTARKALVRIRYRLADGQKRETK